MLSSLVNGVVVGAGYSLMALGVVLIYKASRRFNFAQGEFGTVATFVAWNILEPKPGGKPGSWALAALAALAAGVVMGLLTERLVVRPLRNSPPVTVLVATAGVALLAISIQIIVGEAKIRSISPFSKRKGINVADIPINSQKLFIVFALVVTAVALYAFFRSKVGTALLATSQESFAARIAGIDVNRMSMLTWGMAAFLGAAAGLLFAPLDAFTPGFMTTRRMIPGFTAAVMGGMTSLPGAVLGGFVVGIVEAVSQTLLGGVVAGADLLGVFAALLIVLFIRPQGLLGKEA